MRNIGNNYTLKNCLNNVMPEWIFAILGLFFGVLFLVITPPFQAPDEYSHFYRAYQLSEGCIIGEKDNRNTSGGRLPKGLFIEVGDNISFHKLRKQNISDITRHFTGVLDTKDRVFFYFGNTVMFSPVPYIPQSIAILIGRIFRFPPLMMFYLARLFNLLTWILLVYLAIKFSPISKWLLLILALTPMSLFMACSLSADSMTNGLSFLLIALFLHLSCKVEKPLSSRLLTQDRINEKGLFLIFILCILIALSKQIYSPLVLLYFLIPYQNIGSKRRYFQIGALLFLCCLAFLLGWSLMVRDLIVPIPEMAKMTHISLQEQMNHIIHHPVGFLFSLIRSFKRDYIDYYRMYIGILGWLDTPLPNFIYLSYILILLFAAFFDNHYDHAITRNGKLLFLVIFSLITILIGVIVYAMWNTVGGTVVAGIQGRYFIAFSPLFFLLFYNKKYRIESQWISLVIIIYSYAVLRYSLIVLIERYYRFPMGFMTGLILFDVLLFCVLFFILKTKGAKSSCA